MAGIAAVIVCYDEQPEQIRDAVESLLSQTRPPDSVMIVDNGPGGRLADAMSGYAPGVSTMRSRGDFGYGSAVNFAAERTDADHLLCLNPDARAQSDCLEHLAAVAESDPNVAIVGGQVLLEDGETVNAGANPLHPTGISPSGRYGQAREHGAPREAIVVSGACMLIRREALLRLNGFVEELFLYYEDTNLAWRAFVAGMGVVYCPEATVLHGYEFGGRPQKWFLLERNRLFSVLSNYRLKTLLVLGPMLLATEAGLIAVSAAGGWLPEKLRAYGSLFGLRRAVLSRRRALAAQRRRSDAEVLEALTNRLDSALMSARWSAVANFFFIPYMAIAQLLVHDRTPAGAGPRVPAPGSTAPRIDGD
ncbi:MAG TPA: glycosyltransferase family 2 protein [Solirubrobacteraceae bacterium]|jgi:GT2 family glycosyltransferase|nr:glycosyltransferase family 2 protein [Solirubrobacteraceae bacterium]